MRTVVSLRGSRVELQGLDATDAEAVHRLFGDGDVTRWLSFDSRSVEQCRDMVRGVEERARVEPRSEAVLKKVGMQDEGKLRDHVFTNGEWRDSLLFSILEPEWSD